MGGRPARPGSRIRRAHPVDDRAALHELPVERPGDMQRRSEGEQPEEGLVQFPRRLQGYCNLLRIEVMWNNTVTVGRCLSMSL